MTTSDAAAHADLERVFRQAGGTYLLTVLTAPAVIGQPLAEVPGITRLSVARSTSAWTDPAGRMIHLVASPGAFTPSAACTVVGWALVNPADESDWRGGACAPTAVTAGSPFALAPESVYIRVPG